MAQWLMKAEPDDYSWDQLVADGETEWTGVRNHQAAANMRAMKLDDPVFFYRSMVEPAIVGVMRISAEAYPDPKDASGKFVRVKVKPDRRLPAEVSLKAVKADPRFAELPLVRQSRLSVQPVSDAYWRMLCEMGGLEP